MSDTKPKNKYVALTDKDRESLSRQGETTWMALLPGSVRDGEKPDGSPKWKPSDTEPFKLMLSQRSNRIFLSALDVAALIQLIDENRGAIDDGITIAAGRLKEKQANLQKLLG